MAAILQEMPGNEYFVIANLRGLYIDLVYIS